MPSSSSSSSRCSSSFSSHSFSSSSNSNSGLRLTSSKGLPPGESLLASHNNNNLRVMVVEVVGEVVGVQGVTAVSEKGGVASRASRASEVPNSFVLTEVDGSRPSAFCMERFYLRD